MRRLLLALCLTPAICAAAPGPPETGEFDLTSTLTEVLGGDGARQVAAIYPPEAPVRWEVFVPKGYDPERPPGLLNPEIYGEPVLYPHLYGRGPIRPADDGGIPDYKIFEVPGS